jgi:hypothetical protein
VTLGWGKKHEHRQGSPLCLDDDPASVPRRIVKGDLAVSTGAVDDDSESLDGTLTLDAVSTGHRDWCKDHGSKAHEVSLKRNGSRTHFMMVRMAIAPPES